MYEFCTVTCQNVVYNTTQILISVDTNPNPLLCDPYYLEQIEPYLPYEFTCEGMLQRVNAFIQNQVRLAAASNFPHSRNTNKM